MPPPPDPTTVKVGVLLARGPAELGEWLADATAFEAAGAHALWVDPEPESKLDPLALLAALAALTSRALLVATPPASGYASKALGRTLDTVGRLSHGRLALAAEPGRLEELTALAPGAAAFRRLPGEPAAFERLDETDTGERWVRTPPPEGRAAWRAALAEAVTNGAGTSPMYRPSGASEWQQVSWDFALDKLAQRIKASRDRTFVPTDADGHKVNRTEGIAFAGGAAFSSEEGYFATKLLRAIGIVYMEQQARV